MNARPLREVTGEDVTEPNVPGSQQVREVRVNSASGGQKGTKEAAYHLIPTGPLHELAVLYGRGAAKYAEHNWSKGYPWSLSYAALHRHLAAFWAGEDHDEETGVKHLINVAFHAFALAWFIEHRPDFDDRPFLGEDEPYVGALPTPQWILDFLAEAGRNARTPPDEGDGPTS